MHHQTDVLVVGLGAAGGIIAGELAKAGAKVLALDKVLARDKRHPRPR